MWKFKHLLQSVCSIHESSFWKISVPKFSSVSYMEYTKLIKSQYKKMLPAVCVLQFQIFGYKTTCTLMLICQSAWREIAGERAQNLRCGENLRSQCYYILHSGF
jgi:hypothetical protein